jgi:hypothetical protein
MDILNSRKKKEKMNRKPLLSEKQMIQRFLELDKLFKEGKLESNSSDWNQRRELYFESYQIPGYSNMRPCLADCRNCGAVAYKTFDDHDNPIVRKGGHTGWANLNDKKSKGQHWEFCSEKCYNEWSKAQEIAWEQLKSRTFFDFPAKMDLKTFEEFTLWVAHGFIEQKEQKLFEQNPLLTVPDFLAREFRRILVGQLSEITIVQSNLIGSSGMYSLKKGKLISKSEVCKILDISPCSEAMN